MGQDRANLGSPRAAPRAATLRGPSGLRDTPQKKIQRQLHTRRTSRSGGATFRAAQRTGCEPSGMQRRRWGPSEGGAHPADTDTRDPGERIGPLITT